MSNTTYHITSADGFHAGDVVRMKTWDGPFSDSVILGFTTMIDGEQYTKLARPYAYASSVGTTGPVLLVGTEHIEYVNVSSLKAHYTKVGDGMQV